MIPQSERGSQRGRTSANTPQGWQQKLSQLGVARFPWDPKPDPPSQQPPAPEPPAAPPAAPVALPDDTAHHQQQQFVPALPQQQQQQHNGAGGVKQEGDDGSGGMHIKQEPGFNPLDPANKNNVAASRAAQLMQKQYGERAVGSINAIHSGGQQQQQQQQAQNPEALYRQQMAAATAQAQQQAAANNGGVHPSQTDGAGDEEIEFVMGGDSDSEDGDDEYEGVLMERSRAGTLQELGRVEIDRLMHDRIAAKAKAMEGGGLMLPLKEATRHRTATTKRRRAAAPAAHDGGDDDDDDDEDEKVEADEDAINSDLDDPDEDRSDDEVDDEGLGHIMLCMYDKVQRVKNKWYVSPGYSSSASRARTHTLQAHTQSVKTED